MRTVLDILNVTAHFLVFERERSGTERDTKMVHSLGMVSGR